MIKVKAQARYVRSGPLKIRRIIKLIRGKKAEYVLAQLKFMPNKGAWLIAKV
ncbi:MAG: uL22 family ribosomal protein, partial [Candidatus Margulisiibacteriota bacterium]